MTDLRAGFSIDPDQGFNEADEAQLVRLAAELGYDSAWTPSRADAAAFDRCLRWHEASGLPVGISAVPASGQPPEFYAEHAPVPPRPSEAPSARVAALPRRPRPTDAAPGGGGRRWGRVELVHHRAGGVVAPAAG